MSNAPFEALSNLDRTIHEPARLAVLTALDNCESADFLFLQSLTGLTKGNLNAHLSKLEQAGLVTIEKTFRGKVQRTVIRLSEVGRRAIAAHWKRLATLKTAAERWTAPKRQSEEDT